MTSQETLPLAARLRSMSDQWLALGVPSSIIATNAGQLFHGTPAKHPRSLSMLLPTFFSTTQLTHSRSSVACACSHPPYVYSIYEREKVLALHLRSICAHHAAQTSSASSCTPQPQQNESTRLVQMFWLPVPYVHQNQGVFGNITWRPISRTTIHQSVTPMLFKPTSLHRADLADESPRGLYWRVNWRVINE